MICVILTYDNSNVVDLNEYIYIYIYIYNYFLFIFVTIDEYCFCLYIN